MDSGSDKQLLHRGFGGELEEINGHRFRDLSKLDIAGIFPDHQSAHDHQSARAAWKAKAQQTVDNAQMRYFVVHMQRLLKPADQH